MGLRPNQPRRPATCRHREAPVPVEVHDRLDGRPEVVAWLCPDCYEETHGPPPRGPGGGSPLPLRREISDGRGGIVVLRSWA